MVKRKGLLTVLLFVVGLVVFSSCGDLAGDGDDAKIPTVTLEYKNNFEYKADAGYNALACATNLANTIVVANIVKNGATITKVEFLSIGASSENVITTITSEPYEYDESYTWGWGGPVKRAVKVYYDSNSTTATVTSAVVESYMYSPWYETCVATNTNGNAGYLFRADPEAGFYKTYLNENPVIDVYIAGAFNTWAVKDADYKMTKNGKYYEIILTNISAGEEYKYQFETNASAAPSWMHDRANYWMIYDGVGSWNSVCHN